MPLRYATDDTGEGIGHYHWNHQGMMSVSWYHHHFFNCSPYHSPI